MNVNRFKRALSGVLATALALGMMAQTGVFSVIAAPTVGGEAPAQEQSYESPFIRSENWIWSTDVVTKNSVSYFRKDCELKAAPVSINVKTSAHNYMKFYLNGELITGLCSPATSTIPDNKNYMQYTFSGDELSALLDADNPNQVAFASSVQYLGDNGMNYINGVPGFWAEITLTYADQTTETVVTDESWSALTDTPYKNNTPSQESRRMTAQLDYDAQKMPDPLAFARFGYDTASYTAGSWVSAIPAGAEAATWKMREQRIPEGAVHEYITPTPVGVQEPGVQVFDAGRIVSGFPRIKISAPAGTRICMRYSEDLTGDGRVKHNVANEGSETYCDYYTFSGNGVEEFCPDFTYKAFRYMEIVGLPELIEADAIQIEWASSGIVNTSSFSSSDDMANKIYQMCINTQYNNVQNMPVDCPHREQSQYLGDSQMQYDLLSYAFSDFIEFDYKTLLDFAGAQLKDGSFPFITPTTVEAFDNKIPEYDMRYPDLLYQYYYYSGKTDALLEFYDTAVRVTECYAKFIDGTGMVAKPPYWSISDWPSPAVDDSGTYQTTMNLHMYDAFDKMALISEVLGRDAEAASYRQRADDISAAITANLIDTKTGIYKDSSNSEKRNPGVTAFAIYLGQAPESLRMQQLDYIAKTELEATSVLPSKVILTKPVLHVLLQGNDSHKEAAYEIMTRTTGLEWGRFVAEGYQTCWEGFEPINSHSHAWTAYPAKMFLAYLAGITYNDVNYSGVQVKPYLPEDLSYVEGSLQTPAGETISSRLDRNADGSNSLHVVTEVAARIGVPRFEMANTVVSLGGAVLFENGLATAAASDATYVSNDAQYIYFDVPAGDYTFTSAVKPAGTEENYTLTINATQGGKVLVNGEAIIAPYTATFANGEEVTLEAVADKGMKFDGFSGSFGSSDKTMTFTMGENTTIDAAFSERTDKVYHIVKIDAPEDCGLTVRNGDKTVDLPASLPVVEGEEITLTVAEKADARYNFVAWSGDLFTASREITLDGMTDVNLEVIAEYRADENLAYGKEVTANNSYSEGNLWGPGNLTDGYTTVGPKGQLGFTSGAYDTQDISATPHEFIIDFGRDRSFDTLVLYPRADKTAEDGGSLCFPESYQVSVCADGSDSYTPCAQVTDGGNPMGKPVSVDLGVQTGRYIKITTTKLGPPVLEGGVNKYRVQLAELEVYNNDEQSSEFLLSIGNEGAGSVKINGTVESLPLNKTYPEGTHIVVEPVAATDYRAEGFTGDLTTGTAPLYLMMNRDYNLTANFKSTIASKSANLALGKAVTAANSDGGAAQWGPGYLTDGLTVSTGQTASDGVKGYTSKNYASQDVSNEDLWIEIDLGKDTDFHQIMLYPRTDIAGAGGGDESPNFPVDYRVEYKMDGDDIYRTIGDFKDVENPHGQPATLDFGIQNGRYIRIIPTKLGSPAADDAGGARPYRFQLCEVEVYAVPAAPDNMAKSAEISVKDFAANAGAWSIANLTDGKLRSEGRGSEGGIKGFTSASRPNGQNDISSDPFWMNFAFSTPQEINQFVMYPRSDVDANTKNSGESANFPVDFDLQAKNEATGEFETIFSIKDCPNPGMAPYEINFDTVSTSELKLVVYKLGMPSFDELSKAHYVQLAETRISYVTTESIDTGSIKLSTVDAPEVITTADELIKLMAEIQNSDLANNGIRWSLEDENGFVADIAELIGTNTNTPSLLPQFAGTAYVVARFTNGLPVMDRIPIEIVNAVEANKTILEKVIDKANALKGGEEYLGAIESVQKSFDAALSEAVKIYNSPASSQEQVDAAWVSLMTEIHKLGLQQGNKESLQMHYDLYSKLDLDLYLDGDAKDNFVAALEAAKVMLKNNDAVQSEVDAADDALVAAAQALVKRGDKTTLQSVVDSTASYVEDHYAKGWAEFAAARDAANVVLENPNATQEEVDAATDALIKAMLNLRLKADKSLLNSVIAAAEALDLSGYTKASVEAFEAALNEAKATAADESLSVDEQNQVTEAVNRLSNAVNNLKKADGSSANLSVNGDGSITGGSGSAKTGEATPIAMAMAALLLAGSAIVLKKRR